MKLKSITINHYKSIKTPQKINLEGNLITLLGKNGSGKTNVLQAVWTFFRKRNYGNFLRGDYVAALELCDEEINLYSKDIEISKDKKILAFCNGESPDVVQIESPFLSSSIIEYKKKLEKIKDEINKAGEEYLKALDGFVYQGSEHKDLGIMAYWEKSGHSKTWWFKEETIKNIGKRLEETIKKYDDYIKVVFIEEKINIFDHSIDCRLPYIPQLELTEIESQQICISPVLANCLKLKGEQIEEANVKLATKVGEVNKLLQSCMNVINNKCDEFASIARQINKIYQADGEAHYGNIEKHDEIVESVVKKIKNQITTKCYYLDNESSLLFSNFRNNDRLQQREYFQNENPILMAINKHLIEHNLYKENESILEHSKIEKKRLDAIIEIVNKVFLPTIESKFDKGEYKRIRFEYKDNILNLMIEEKSGDLISFNDTSLGRRWYFTYSFVKAILDKGDYLLIDEPASFLHPSAQQEVLNELKGLSQKGIKIIYSTHSPYMIDEDSELIKIDNYISTTILPINTNELNDFTYSIGIVNFNDFLLGLSKTFILVEGQRDVSCLKVMMQQLDLSPNNYSLFQLHGAYNIDKLMDFFIENKVSYKIILDADTMSWATSTNDDKKRIGEFVAGFIKGDKKEKMFFAGENKARKEIEGLFSKEDAINHFELALGKEKVKIEFKKSVDEFGLSEETKQNFRELFKIMGII